MLSKLKSIIRINLIKIELYFPVIADKTSLYNNIKQKKLNL